MAAIGGYKVINLSDYEFTLTGAKIVPGMYEAIESSKKLIILEGLRIKDTTIDAGSYVAGFDVSDSDYVAILVIGAAQYQITVSANNTVTIISAS